MAQLESFDEIVSRLREGDEDAAREVFNRYSGRLIGLARSRLNTKMQAKIDPEDVLQSVFRSFFVRQGKGQFDLDDWDSLWSLLVRITLRKCGRRIEAFHAQRRDVRREIAQPDASVESCCQWEAIAREPTAQEAILLTETVEQLMERLDQIQQQILALRLQGYTVPEISHEVGRTERTVHRVLRRVREALQSHVEKADS